MVRRRRDSVPRLAFATLAWVALVSAAFAQQAPQDSAAPLFPPQPPGTGAPPAADAQFDLPHVNHPNVDDPRKTKPVVKSPPRLKHGALPALRPYVNAQRLGLRGGATDRQVGPDGTPKSYEPPSPTVAAASNPYRPPHKPIRREADPYAPLGLRLGDIVLRPYIEEDVGYATNPLGANSGGKSSPFETTEAGAAWQSDWARNDFHGQLKGGFTDYFKTTSANSTYGSGTFDLRLDATRDLSFDAEGRFNVAPQSLSNFGLTAVGGQAPYVGAATYGGSLGVAERLGDFTLALHGAYDRQQYQDVALFGAALPSLSADDYGDWTAKLRASYRVSDAVSPFVEFDYDWRRYDAGTDALGYARDSTGYAALGGVTLGFSKMLTGEASVGYGMRQYEDARLPQASAWLTNAALTWTPTALTTVTARAQTLLNDAVMAGASADINRSYSLDVAHSLTRLITLGVTGTFATDNYIGQPVRDGSFTETARAELHVNRNLVLKASASHQNYNSNQLGQSYVGDVFLLGLRLQD